MKNTYISSSYLSKLLSEGKTCLASKNYSRAIQYLSEYNKISPSLESFLLLCDALYSASKYQEALKILEKAKNYSINTSDLAKIEAKINDCKGKLAKPKEAIRNIVKKNPLQNKSHQISQKVQESAEDIPIQGKYEKESQKYFNEGNVLRNNKEYEKAIACYTKSIEHILLPYAFAYMGVCKDNLGRKREAISDYQTFLDLSKKNTEMVDISMVYIFIGECYEDCDDLYKAKDSFEIILKMPRNIIESDIARKAQSLLNPINKRIEVNFSQYKNTKDSREDT